MKIISMKQLRQKFHLMRKGLGRGESYILMYRSKPLAVVRPYKPETDARHLAGGYEPAQAEPERAQQEMLKTLPDPKTVSFGSRLAQTNNNFPEKVPAKPLDKLRVKRAFL